MDVPLKLDVLVRYRDELCKAVLDYLNGIDYFCDLQDKFVACSNFDGIELYKKPEVFYCEVPVKILAIFDINSLLGELLVSRFEDVRQLFHHIIFNKIQVQSLLTQNISFDQLYVVLRVHETSSAVLQIKEPSDLISTGGPQMLLSFKGMVSDCCMPEKYVRSTVYECNDFNCKMTQGPFIVRIFFSPCAGEEEITGQDYPCGFCSSQLAENKAYRIYGDRLFLKVTPLPIVINRSAPIVRPLTVCCRDEIISLMKIGCQYSFVGNKAFRVVNNKLIGVMEINTAKEIKASTPWPVAHPLCIESVYQNFVSSPWQFAFHMAYIFTDFGTVPQELYFGVKLLLLLNLVNSPSSQNFVLPSVLVLAFSDTSVANRLIHFASSFSPSAISHPSLHASAEPESSLVDSSSNVQNNFLDCSVILADATVISSIHLRGRKKFFDADCLEKTLLHIKSEKLQKLIRSYSFVCRTNPWETDEAYLLLAAHQLENAIGDAVPNATLTRAQWNQYIECAKGIQVEMTAEAEELIQKYYVARREYARQQKYSFDASETVLQMIIMFSESYSKLCFAKKVDIYHVAVAIMLVEENFLVWTGISPLPTFQLPKSTAKTNPLFSMRQTDEEMAYFLQEIINFVS